ncbi:MAG: hypothetical protein HUJ31_04095, partial [Pseudomonadales bacterium]|nr:hypothetical protein [Pseudomonadales bacterium]
RSFEMAQAELAGLDAGHRAEVAAIDAFIAFRQWRWQEASRLFRQSIDQNPRLADTYVWYSQFQSAVGRNQDALKTAQLAYDLDSVSPVVNDRLATAWLWVDENELALARYGSGASLGFDSPVNPAWMNLLLRRGEFELVGNLLQEIHGPGIEPLARNIHRLSEPGFRGEFRATAAELVDSGVLAPRFELPLWILLGEFDRVLSTVDKYRDRKKFLDVEFLFSAESAPLRDAPEFDRITRILGLDHFWQASGPPDFRKSAPAP